MIYGFLADRPLCRRSCELIKIGLSVGNPIDTAQTNERRAKFNECCGGCEGVFKYKFDSTFLHLCGGTWDCNKWLYVLATPCLSYNQRELSCWPAVRLPIYKFDGGSSIECIPVHPELTGIWWLWSLLFSGTEDNHWHAIIEILLDKEIWINYFTWGQCLPTIL